MTIEEQIDLVNSRVNMLDYVSQYTDFTKKGGEYWALSPLTAERTPSFSINTDKMNRHVFKDFSSGCSGDIVDFVKAYEGCGTKKAIEILSAYASIDGAELSKRTHLQSSEVAKSFRRKASVRKDTAHKILPSNYMDRYQKNHPSLQLWRDEGISDETMRKFEVCFDPFSNRIVFPLRDNSGNIINIIGRTVDPDFKMKKMRKYTYFHPLGNLDILYGFAEAHEEIAAKKEIRKLQISDTLIVTEAE